MTLKETRKWFIKASGRYDLVVDTTDWADNGANVYINAGLRWLDRQVEFLNQYAKMFRSLSAGSYLIKIPRCRAIDSVNTRKSDGTIASLTMLTFQELREKYPEDVSTVASGVPSFYSIVSLRQHDEADSSPPSTEGIVSSDWKSNDGLLVMPPPSEDLVVIIEGKFASTQLSADEDENFWTLNEPNILVKAGLRELEAFYRNRSGVEDWTASIMHDLVGVEKDYIEKAFSQFDQLEG